MSFNRALAALESGARVIVTHSENAQGGVFWSIDGRTIHPSAVKKLKPGLHPLADGLFDADTSQSYEWAGWPE